MQNLVLTVCHCCRSSRQVMSDSLRPHGLQHTRLPCPSLSPRVCSYSCPLSWWCHLTIFIICQPLLLLPSIFCNTRDFFSELAFCIGWPEYWSFKFPVSPSNEYSGPISLRSDWLITIANRISNRWGLLALSCFSSPPVSITVICPSGSPPSYTVT